MCAVYAALLTCGALHSQAADLEPPPLMNRSEAATEIVKAQREYAGRFPKGLQIGSFRAAIVNNQGQITGWGVAVKEQMLMTSALKLAGARLNQKNFSTTIDATLLPDSTGERVVVLVELAARNGDLLLSLAYGIPRKGHVVPPPANVQPLPAISDREVAAKLLGGKKGSLKLYGSAQEIKSLEQLPNGDFLIQEVVLDGPDCTDADVDTLAGAKHLVTVFLTGREGAEFTDDALKKLNAQQHPYLRELGLGHFNCLGKDISCHHKPNASSFTPAGLAALQSLRSLVYLQVRYCELDEANQEALVALFQALPAQHKYLSLTKDVTLTQERRDLLEKSGTHVGTAKK